MHGVSLMQAMCIYKHGQKLRSTELEAKWQSMLWKSLQMLARCHSLHLRAAPEWHGVTSPSLSFASLHLPPCAHFSLLCLALCPHFLGLSWCWLHFADPSNITHVWNNETASTAGALGTLNLCKFVLSFSPSFLPFYIETTSARNNKLM